MDVDESSQGCCHRMDGTNRNLIVCIDGTDNQFGDKNTNVVELYNLILKGDKYSQRTWYNSGIGTYVRPSSWASFGQHLLHKIDSAIAINFERTILGAYRWLSDNYESGDCIFLFGFSRGAFQVRVLSAMINKVGLIYKGNEMQIPFAYELYRNSDRPTANGLESSSTGSEERITSATRFKKVFSCENVQVHFVGAWDTVSSIGLTRRKAMLPGTVDGMQHVCYFRHALALDERRVKFLPEYAYGSWSPPETTDATSPRASKTGIPSASADRVTNPPKVLEVWFAGTHSDIGGGNAANSEANRSRPPLRWMVFEAGKFGLRTTLFNRELTPGEQTECQESLLGLWWCLEFFPFRRLTYAWRDEQNVTTYRPHLGSRRKIHPGQKIHSSLIVGDKSGYVPKARPVNFDDPGFWEKFRNESTVKNDWLECDLYTYANELVEQYINTQDIVVLQTLGQIATSVDGIQAVCTSILNQAVDVRQDIQRSSKLLFSTRNLLDMSPRKLKVEYSTRIRELVSAMQKKDCISEEQARHIVSCCTDPCLHALSGHTGFVNAVVIDPKTRMVASASNDHTIRFWDIETGNAIHKISAGAHSYLTSVAFSHDGSRLGAGSYDNKLRLWEMTDDEPKPLGIPFDTQHVVTSVAFSPVDMCLVSGSDNGTIRVWNIQVGLTEQAPISPIPQTIDQIWSVAFSPNGRQIVSGSSKGIIQIWDVEGKPVTGPFMGHAVGVRSIAWSRDGEHVLSGSSDGTVRMWNPKTGTIVGEPLRGHTGWVNSVACSPDSERVVSGSSDYSARVWDIKLGYLIRVLDGHEGTVTSVAYSNDGRRIVTGSHDKTVRIWDAEAIGLQERR